MNTRLKELMLEAGYAAPELAGRARKLSELIVAECLKIAKNREDEFESAGLLDESNAVGNVAYRISRQFGVKR
jgi:hypothetical protein